MTVFPETWNSTYNGEPADNENISLGASRIRSLKTNIQARVAVDHSFAGDANDGLHLQSSYLVSASDPAPVAGIGFMYTKTISGHAELFYEDDNSHVLQLTSAGNLIPSAAGIIAGLGYTPGHAWGISVLSVSTILTSTSFETLLLAASSTGDITITFPNPSGFAGRAFWVFNFSAHNMILTVPGGGGFAGINSTPGATITLPALSAGFFMAQANNYLVPYISTYFDTQIATTNSNLAAAETSFTGSINAINTRLASELTYGGIGSSIMLESSSTSFTAGTTYSGSTIGAPGAAGNQWLCTGAIALTAPFKVNTYIRTS